MVNEELGAGSETSLRIAVTGASGFIGSHLVSALRRLGNPVLPLVRRQVGSDAGVVVDLANPDLLTAALADVDVLVHCAGFAHAHEGRSPDEDKVHQLVNCTYVLNAARAAAQAGLRRFVFCSSVKATGDPGTRCVDEKFDAPPTTSYGRAKRSAEQGLASIGAMTGMQIVILRFAMVYGQGSRGNLERMLRLVAKRRFPPLPETGNKRSMVHISDVIAAIRLAALHRSAAGRTYIVAHPRAISGRELYDVMCEECFGSTSRWAVPAGLLRLAGQSGDLVRDWFGMKTPLDSQSVSRLLDSACYSPAAIQSELGWTPRTEISDGIRHFVSSQTASCEDGKESR